MGLHSIILVFWKLSFKPAFSLCSFTLIKRFFSSSLLFAIRVVSSAYVTTLIAKSKNALEKEMATHSSVLAWRIPGTGEPCGLPSMGLHRVRHDWSDLAAAAAAAANLRLLIFLLAILIPACDSSSLAFRMMYSAYTLNKLDDNI